MRIEEEIFQHHSLQEDKLLAYGFKKENDYLVFSKNIINDTLKVVLKVDNSLNLDAKIYDLEFGDEYQNFRFANQAGGYIFQVKEALREILIDVRDKCSTLILFISNQANRIERYILNKYEDKAIFPFEKFASYGVYKNKKNNKWYAIIMQINARKLDINNDEIIEIINLKLEPSLISSLIDNKHFFPAYHMNKINWLSIILEGNIKDEIIFDLIDKSHAFTLQHNTWLTPANPTYFDIAHAFDRQDEIVWKQSTHIEVGDIVYMYVGSPYSYIMYKTEVTQTDIPYHFENKKLKINKLMKLKLIKKMEPDLFNLDKLKQYGVFYIRGPLKINKKLKEALDEYLVIDH